MKRLLLALLCATACTDDGPTREESSRVFDEAMTSVREGKCESGGIAVQGSTRRDTLEVTATLTGCSRGDDAIDGTLKWTTNPDHATVTGTLTWEGAANCEINIHIANGKLTGTLCGNDLDDASVDHGF